MQGEETDFAFYSPPILGGVRGGMSEGRNHIPHVLSLTHTPPYLPYPRGRIQTHNPIYSSKDFRNDPNEKHLGLQSKDIKNNRSACCGLLLYVAKVITVSRAQELPCHGQILC